MKAAEGGTGEIDDPEATSRVMNETSLRIAGKRSPRVPNSAIIRARQSAMADLCVTTSFGLPSRAHWNTENTV